MSLLLGLAYLPLVTQLRWQISAFIALLLLLRIFALRWPAALPGRWVLLTLTLLGVLNCLDANHSLTGKVGGTALLATMLTLKLLELRTRRDLRVLAIALGLLIVAHFLFAQGPDLALYLGAVTVAAVWVLVDLNGGLGPAPGRRALQVTLRLCLQALPLTLVLFLLFPRLNAPLWSLSLDQETATMGMSDRLEPGSISELVINGELAFRARFRQSPPPRSQLYWRGLVLWEVDERRWTVGPDPNRSGAPPGLTTADDLLDYDIILEPSNQRWLFALDLPVESPPDAVLSRDFRLTATRPITGPRRYRLRSAVNYRTAEPTAAERQQALQLPPLVSNRLRELVAAWRRDTDSDWDLVQKALTFFNREAFHYTLLPPRLGPDPWDAFLFETRRGFCEHYAGSFSLLMRLGGVPARVVVGYLGGEPNAIGGYHMVWQSDAHAWAEVLIADRGWVRVDPTAAVAPSRVDNREASRLLSGSAPIRFHLEAANPLVRGLRHLRHLADSMEAAWQGWVLDFSAARQERLLERLGLDRYGEFALAGLMVAAVSLVMGLILLALVRQGTPLDPVSRDYRRFCRRLAAIGLSRAPAEGPLDFAHRIAGARPDLAPAVECIVALYVGLRYAGTAGPEDQQRLTRLVRRFRPHRYPSSNALSNASRTSD
jgi:transglutaminase-like putative cysteine protease